MSGSELNYIPNRTAVFFSKLNKIWSITGLPNLWLVDKNNNKISRYFHGIITVFIYVLVLIEFGSFFTQHRLTEKQKNDRLIFNFAHPVLLMYFINLTYYKTNIKNLLLMLCITLKKAHNDLDVEMKMIRKGSFYSIFFSLTACGTLILYGFDSLMQVIHTGGSFTTVITAWPDIEDSSLTASVVRVISYVGWWVFTIRVMAMFTLLIMTTVLLSHQYKNLQNYFYRLNDIFQDDTVEVNHEEKELKYLEALKVGLKLHSDTLWCTRQCQEIFSLMYSGQILVNVFVLCVLMLQMMNSERTLVNAVTIVCLGITTLGSSGFIMWNAGDITFEAALIPTAIFSSGWHHCRGATSAKVRKLLITAMIQGQRNTLTTAFKQKIRPETIVGMMLSSKAAWDATSKFMTEVLQDLRRTEKQREGRKQWFRIQDGRAAANAFSHEVMPNGGSTGKQRQKSDRGF
ncbi:unnamed protein product [Euphydryas editha]|uniref:Odorant receptor n=1 Tax=Euphydryas editha TaxID=104508 RepID=A0AAU9V1L3_EUPED|nr:unnamed protein product [Euphydryas editha]